MPSNLLLLVSDAGGTDAFVPLNVGPVAELTDMVPPPPPLRLNSGSDAAAGGNTLTAVADNAGNAPPAPLGAPQSLVVDVATDVDDGVVSAGNLSFREALRLIGTGSGTISFASSLAGQTITNASTWNIDGTVTINGDVTGDKKADVTLSGGGGKQLFYAGVGTNVTFQSLNLADGWTNSAKGCGIVTKGSLLVRDSSFSNMWSPTGGAIYSATTIANPGTVKIYNSFFTTVMGQSGGGIVHSVNTPVTISQVTATNITSTYYLFYVKNALMKIDSTTAITNASQATVRAEGVGSLQLTNSVFTGNNTFNEVTLGDTATGTANNSLFSIKPTFVTAGVLGNKLGSQASCYFGTLDYHNGTTKTFNIIDTRSVLINAGSNSLLPSSITADANGLLRIRGSAVDMGATEYRPASATPVITAVDKTINENIAAVETVTFTDAMTYSMVSGKDSAFFTFNASTGALAFTSAPDFENKQDANRDNIYEVDFTATDGLATVTKTVKVTVANVNEAPVFSSAGTVSVNENQTAVTTVAAADPEGTGVIYSISLSADSSKFTIDQSTGVLTFNSAPDFEARASTNGNNTYTLLVSAMDAGFNSSSQTVTVTVLDVNEAPAISSSTFTVNENATAVGTISASDPDANTTLTYSLTGQGADDSKFNIDASTGALTFKAAPDYEKPGSASNSNTYSVQVGVTDNGNIKTTKTISVSVANVNEAPVFTTSSLSALENGTAIGSVVATDPEAASVSYSITGGNDRSFFSITSAGVLSFVSARNYESPQDFNGDNGYEVIVTASDTSGKTSSATITVNVQNVNEAPNISTLTLSLAENTRAAGTVVASDPDAGDTMTYSLSGTDSVLFDISSTGALTFKNAPDFEAKGSANLNNAYTILVTVTDAAGLSKTKGITVNVTDVNEAPAFTGASTYTVFENATTAGTVAASDPDAGATLTYSLVTGGDSNLFNIDANTGALSFKTAPDFENPGDAGADNGYTVTVRVTDGANPVTKTVTVNVRNVDEAPSISSSSYSAAENGTSVGTVAASDPDANTTLTYSISGADSGLFDIDTGTGVLSFKSAPNFEARGSAANSNAYSLTVTVSDGNNSVSKAITVNVTDVNEAPVIISAAAFAISENHKTAGAVTASDPDAGATLTYSIDGGDDASLFTIDSSTGVLSFRSAADYESPADQNSDNDYVVTVKVSDGSLDDLETVVVTVQNGNEAPVVSTAGYTITENGTRLGKVAATDPDYDAITWSITGGDDAALFTIDQATGVIAFLSAPDADNPADQGADNIYSVEVSAFDGKLTTARTLTITVQGVNEAPVIGTTAFTPDENSTTVGSVGGSDEDGNTLNYAITGGSDAGLFTIDASTGVLSFRSAPDFDDAGDNDKNNEYLVQVTVDDGKLSDVQEITVTLQDLDEAPEFTATALSLSENGTAAGSVAATDPDGKAITYAISGGKDALLFDIDAQTGALSFKQAPDFDSPGDFGADNVYNVTVEADDGTLSSRHGVSVTVQNVNEAPVIATTSLAPDENGTAAGTVLAGDEDGNTLTYSISGGIDAARFIIDSATGALTFVNAPDFEAPDDDDRNNEYLIEVTADDGVLQDVVALTVTVKDQNEAPVITSAGFSIVENGTSAGTVKAADPESDVLSYALTGGADKALFTIDAGTGALSFLAAPNYEVPGDFGGNNVYRVKVEVSDGSLASEELLSVTVTGVNEGPSITTRTLSLDENGTAAGTVRASDPEGDTLTYSISGGLDAGLFTISGTGALNFISAPDYDDPLDDGKDNGYDVEVSVSDGVFTEKTTVTVHVRDVNEAPVITTSAFTALEGDTAAGAVSAADPEGSALSYSISGGDDSSAFTIDATTGALSFTITTDYANPVDQDADNDYLVEVTVDDGVKSTAQLVTVSVQNANGAPVINTTAFTVAEHGSVTAGSVDGTDPDGNALTYSIVGGNDAVLFAIDPSTGVLSFKTAPDYDDPDDAGKNNVYDVQVKADDGALADIQNVTVSVQNINEAPAVSTTALTLSENSVQAGTVSASDPDGDTLRYSITGGDDSALFTIDRVTGALSFRSAPDFEAPGDKDSDNEYVVKVTAGDGTLGTEQTIAIAVQNDNEAPAISTTGLTIIENGTAAGRAVASDPENDALTWSITGGADAALFTIDTATGALSFLSAPDYETPGSAALDNSYLVRVRASDGTLADSSLLTVGVLNADEAPVITASTLTPSENTTAAGSITASDPEGSPIEYSISGGADAALFTINRHTGSLNFRTAPDYDVPSDSDGNNRYLIQVTASDGSLHTVSDIAVEVQNVDEDPVITTATLAMIENGTAAGRVSATDPDGKAVPYTITGGDDAALFEIDSATGALRFKSAPDYEAPADKDTDNAYEVRVRASDGTLSTARLLTVSVTDVNEAPAIAAAGLSVLENNTAAGSAAGGDPDGDRLTYSISGGEDAALFDIDGATGALTFKSAPDYEAPDDHDHNGEYVLQVKASDGTLTGITRFTVQTADVNEAPVITASSLTMNENESTAGQMTAEDPENAVLTWSITGSADGGLFTVNSATGVLRFVSAPDREAPADANRDNVYKVELTADDGYLSDTSLVSVTVADVNEAPVITTASLSLAENRTAAGTILADDPEGSALLYTITGGNDAALFTINSSNGVLRFVSAPDFENPLDQGSDNHYDVRVTVSDGSASTGQTIDVEVLDVPESTGGGTPSHEPPPSLHLAGTEFTVHNGIANAGLLRCAGPDGSLLPLSIARGGDGALFTLDPLTGALRFITPPDFSTPSDADHDNHYVVRIRDTGTHAVQTVVVTVSDGPSPIMVSSLSNRVDPNDGITSFREAVIAASHSHGPQVITFDAGMKGKTITLSGGAAHDQDGRSASGGDSALTLRGNVTILGDVDGDGKADVTLSGGGLGRVVDVAGRRSHVTLSAVTLSGGLATADAEYGRKGGAVLVREGATLTLVNSTVSDSSGMTGGGIFSDGTLILGSSLITGNSAGRDGGGIAVGAHGTATIVDSTIAYNRSEGAGGGIAMNGAAAVSLGHVTIARNEAATGGGAAVTGETATGSIRVFNTVIAQNAALHDADADFAGAAVTASHSASGSAIDGPRGGLKGMVEMASGIRLGALLDNGGPVLSLALLDRSSLIGAGGPRLVRDAADADGDGNRAEWLQLDGRGGWRLVGAETDAGAVEYRMDERITGTNSADRILGGRGDDILDGGKGHDSLNGGRGDDIFILHPGARGSDRVIDFDTRHDSLALLAPDLPRSIGHGALDAELFALGMPREADDRIIYDPDTGKLFLDADGSADAHARLIAIIAGHPQLGAGDILIL